MCDSISAIDPDLREAAMNPPSLQPHAITPSGHRARAALAGIGLGGLAWRLSTVPDTTGFTLAMALTMLLAGAASVVLHSLHVQDLADGMAAAARPRGPLVRSCVSWLGGGFVSAMASSLRQPPVRIQASLQAYPQPASAAGAAAPLAA
eukprot:gene2083-2734_t